MPTGAPTVTVQIDSGPSATVPWQAGMNAQQAMEAMWRQLHDTDTFTYALQYYGAQLGYLVFMVNETYDTFVSKAKPYYYWEFLLNGQPSGTGIDGTTLAAGDAVEFRYSAFDPAQPHGVQMPAKHAHQRRVAGDAGRADSAIP